MERADVSFPSGQDRCAAWLYRPAGEGPAPCVVMGGGFGGVREMRLDAYAERFAAAGLAALVFDYRHWGASQGEPRQLVDIRRQLADWRAAIACARALDGVDPGRVALWGTSFGGGHVIDTAAEDPAVAAAVAQCPFVDGRDTLRVLGAWGLVRGLPAILRDELRARRRRPPFYRPISGPPGALAALTTPDAEEGIRSLVPPGAPWRNAHTPRVGLRVGRYRPGRAAPRVRSPLLLCICEHDLLTPAERATRVARSAPRGEARLYPIGHFEIYFGEWFERAVSDQIEFLRRHLLGDGSAGVRAASGDAAGRGPEAEAARAQTTTPLPAQ
ncbi:MAG: alpha/beta hydrolase [Actinomycetota bacterium]|nr:alpha/beta hydrolase [Actinomycetota bacterium]